MFCACNALGGTFFGPAGCIAAVGKAGLVSPEKRKKEWEWPKTNFTEVCVTVIHGLSLLGTLNRFESDRLNYRRRCHGMVKRYHHKAARVLLDGFHIPFENKIFREAFQYVER